MEVRVDWPVRLHDRIPLKLVLQGQVVRSATREVALSIKRYQFRTAAHSGIDVKKAEETANAGIPSIWADPDPSEIAAT